MKHLTAFRVLFLLALMCSVATAQTFKTMTPMWSLKPGDRGYLTSTSSTGANDNLQRGIGYNALNNHVLLVSRWTNGAASGSSLIQGIYVLDGDTGSDITTLNTNGISGGTFLLLKIGVAADGAIYAANFGTYGASSPIKIYRWADESSAPTVAFSGDPSNGTTNLQWGTTLQVRGSGTSTEILLGSNGKVASLLRTSDGSTFTPTQIVTDAAAGDFEHGVAFGTGNSFWGKAVNRNLRKFNYDPATNGAVTVLQYDTNSLASSSVLGQLAADPANGLLACLETPVNPAFSGTGVVARQNKLRLYDVSNSGTAPVLLDVRDFPVNVPNRNSAGAIAIGNGKIFALSCNNGLMAFSIDSTSASAPQMITAPSSQRLLIGGSATYTVYSKYANTFQWQRNGTNVSGATNPSLTLTNVQLSDSATYSVKYGNSIGTNTASAQLTVYHPNSVPRFSPLWSYKIGNTVPPLTFSSSGDTPFDRSLAYNSLSNQVVYADRTGATAGLTVNVLNADTGTFLYKLKTTGITGGAINLMNVVISDDGSVYAANMQTDARSGQTVGWKLYRWASTDTNLDPVVIFQGEPADLYVEPNNLYPATRWGDTLAIRGSGAQTEILTDAWDHEYGSILTPAGIDLNTTWNHVGFLQYYYTGSIGRSLQFGSAPNTFWQKRKAERLQLSQYDPNTRIATALTNYSVFPDSTGPVTLDFTNNLLAALDAAPSTSVPDTLLMYEISDLSAPLLIGSYAFPTNRQANNNNIGQIVFGGGKVFALDGNNGIIALSVQTGGFTNPPVIVAQPQGYRTMAGRSSSLSVAATSVESYQWRKNGVNILGATTNVLSFSPTQLTNAGTYSVVLSNSVGITTSSNAVVAVEDPGNYYSLVSAWGLGPTNRTYFTVDTDAQGRFPFYRSLAYNSLSNHLYIATRVTATSGQQVNVLDASNGNDLYQLDVTGISGGSIVLLGVAVADDGAIYAANEDTTAASGAAVYKLYRWSSAAPNVPPATVYSGEPAGLSTPYRWGDTLAVRGSGTNTEVLIDSNQGAYAALLKPTDSSMSAFASSWFSASYGAPPIGRSLQFGTNNTFWQKRSGGSLQLSSYDLGAQTSTVITNYNAFPGSLGPVGLDFSRNLLAGINFSGVTTTPDTLDLYDISNPADPLLIAKYNFPTNSKPNGNVVGQVVFAGNKVFALDGNNGVVAFTIASPANSAAPTLNFSKSGSTLNFAWSDSVAILQSATDLSGPWTDLTTAGQTNSSQPITGPLKFYRLRK